MRSQGAGLETPLFIKNKPPQADSTLRPSSSGLSSTHKGSLMRALEDSLISVHPWQGSSGWPSDASLRTLQWAADHRSAAQTIASQVAIFKFSWKAPASSDKRGRKRDLFKLLNFSWYSVTWSRGLLVARESSVSWSRQRGGVIHGGTQVTSGLNFWGNLTWSWVVAYCLLWDRMSGR